MGTGIEQATTSLVRVFGTALVFFCVAVVHRIMYSVRDQGVPKRNDIAANLSAIVTVFLTILLSMNHHGELSVLIAVAGFFIFKYLLLHGIWR